MRLPFQQQVESKLYTFYALGRAGFVRPERPDTLARVIQILLRWGASPAAAIATSAARFPNETAIEDELGNLNFREVHRRSNALASALQDRGVVEGDGVAILARNHRYFVESTIACAKLGARALYLNTSFAAPQAREVLEREKPKATIYDAEFAKLISHATQGRRTKRFVAWTGDEEGITGDELLEDLIESADPEDVVPPDEQAKFVILTSGTTGTPKGASRSAPKGLDPIAGLFGRVPYHVREKHFIAAPLFHAWGIGQYMIGAALSATLVLQNRFDPEKTLAAIDEHRPSVLAVVPIMLARILDLPQEVRAKYDTSSLRIVFASGSALPGELAERWMNAFGDNLYNLYGSTEVAWATIATPEDLRKAPGTAGKPPKGTILKIVDKNGDEVPQGETGRIFVGSELVFEGYTGGGSKETSADGLMSTGDMGHIDEEGRLFIDSREDDMIVSGGENVYPGEVEELLSKHPKISDAAVVGVEDKDFGQRLKAFVVISEGSELSEDEVKAYVKEHLARYKVPRDVEFLDELPRNATGKVLKRELQGKTRLAIAIDGVSKWFGIRWVHANEVHLTIREELINAGGLLSGVVGYAMVDYCMGSTLWKETTEEEAIATIGISINYIQTATEGDVVCTTELHRRNRTSAVMSSEVRHEDGRLLATAIGSYTIFKRRDRGGVRIPAAE